MKNVSFSRHFYSAAKCGGKKKNLFLMTIEDLKKLNFDTFHSWVEAGIITEEEWQRREEIVCKKVYGELPESLRE